jgi:hypothetical protein
MGVPPCRRSQVESDGEGESACEYGGDVYRVSLEEGVVDDLLEIKGSAFHERVIPRYSDGDGVGG